MSGLRSKGKRHNHTGRGKSGRAGAKLAQRRRDRRSDMEKLIDRQISYTQHAIRGGRFNPFSGQRE